MPASIKELLMARIDQLGRAKETAQLAAIVDPEFDFELLEELSSAEKVCWETSTNWRRQASFAGLLMAVTASRMRWSGNVLISAFRKRIGNVYTPA